MAIAWGSYEGGMRVGIDVDWGAVASSSDDVTAVVRYYTDNSQTFDDGQTLNFSGHIGGSVNYTNNESGSSGATLRATRNYTWTYSSNSYGSSPGTRTFTVSASGLYTGGTPSRSVTTSIPARPIAAPLSPINAAASRISDTQTKVTWTNRESAQRPWDSVLLQRKINDGSWVSVSSSISGSASSYTHATSANNKYQYQVRSTNSEGTSIFAVSDEQFTTPAAPTAADRADIAGPGQRITWSNVGVNYSEYTSEVLAIKAGGVATVIGTVASGVTTFDHLASNATPYTAADRWKYVVRHKAVNGSTPLYSANSNETSETPGVTSPPSAPTNLNPTGGVSQDPTQIIPLEWKHNSTDTSLQQQYQIRHRVVGSATWTTLAAVASAVSSHNLAANTYTNGQNVEWQVATKGADAAFGPFSASATFTALISSKIPLHLDSGTGRYEADLAGRGWTGLAKPAARVTRVAAQACADGASTSVLWDTVEYTRDGATAGSSGITVPRSGLYRINAQVGLVTAVASGGLVQISVTVNGSSLAALSRNSPAGSSPTVGGGSIEVLLNAGDVVSAFIFHTNGASRNTFGGTFQTALSVSYNGPAT